MLVTCTCCISGWWHWQRKTQSCSGDTDWPSSSTTCTTLWPAAEVSQYLHCRCLLLHQLACAHHCSSPTGCVSCGKFMSLPQDRGCDRASTILSVLNTHTHTCRGVHIHMWSQTHPHRCLCYFLMCNLQVFMPSSGVCFGLLGTL